MKRREFLQNGLGAVVSYGLLHTLITRDLLAAEVRPITDRWAAGLNELCLDLRRRSVTLVEWQRQVEALLEKIELADLLGFIDFDRLTRGFAFPDLGAATKPVPFPALEGLPERLAFHKKIFGLRKGRAIIPHGHRNMVSSHLVLKGDLALRQYDRVEDTGDHLIVRPTVDERATAGSASSISDDRNNIHWFRTLSDEAFTFDVIMTDIDPSHGASYEIDNLDMAEAESLSGGLLRARKLPVDEALERYGKDDHHGMPGEAAT